jgi:hypothetical protein
MSRIAVRVFALACGILVVAGLSPVTQSGALARLRSYPLFGASSPWFAGYRAQPGPRITTDVSAVYQLPLVSCARMSSARMLTFVGVSGVRAGWRWAYQAGTSVTCQSGVATYGLWYRRVGDPADHGQRRYVAVGLRPGDRVSAEIMLNAALPRPERSSIYLVWPGAGNSRVIVGPVPGESDRQLCGVSRFPKPTAPASGSAATTRPGVAIPRAYPLVRFAPLNMTCSFRGVDEVESPQYGVTLYSIPITRVDMVGENGRALAFAEQPMRTHAGLERMVWHRSR